jgi:glycosyltransferase involved in cell wall biosynthesis
MRVLVCHVRYRQAGGEDTVFETEIGVLRDAGVDVTTLDLSSADLGRLPLRARAEIMTRYTGHAWGRAVIRNAVERHRPDVVHFHNLYPLLGPGAIKEADALGCATVQTLHNYRLSCLAGTHLLKGAFCQLCGPTRFWHGVRHACYRASVPQSCFAAAGARRQWLQFINGGAPACWLALTPFMRDHFIGFGAPAERLLIKANSVGEGRPHSREGRSGVFCGGRLSPEKGIVELMRSWPQDAPTLTIAGGGPLVDEMRAHRSPNIRFLGPVKHDTMTAEIRKALVVAMPSISPEPLPLVALEAFAEGTPVVAFEAWSLGSVVRDISADCVVDFRDFSKLAKRALEIGSLSQWDQLSARCVELWRQTYSHEVNVAALLAAYDTARRLRRAR